MIGISGSEEKKINGTVLQHGVFGSEGFFEISDAASERMKIDSMAGLDKGANRYVRKKLSIFFFSGLREG